MRIFLGSHKTIKSLSRALRLLFGIRRRAWKSNKNFHLCNLIIKVSNFTSLNLSVMVAVSGKSFALGRVLPVRNCGKVLQSNSEKQLFFMGIPNEIQSLKLLLFIASSATMNESQLCLEGELF